VYVGTSSGPRACCVTVGDGSQTDQSVANQIPSVENPTIETFGEQNHRYVPMTTRESSENSVEYSTNIPANRPIGWERGVTSRPIDPFDFHVYVGFSPKKPRRSRMHKQVENQTESALLFSRPRRDRQHNEGRERKQTSDCSQRKMSSVRD